MQLAQKTTLGMEPGACRGLQVTGLRRDQGALCQGHCFDHGSLRNTWKPPLSRCLLTSARPTRRCRVPTGDQELLGMRRVGRKDLDATGGPQRKHR